MQENSEMVDELTTALGQAVVTCWAKFPQDIQRMLFETAAARDANGFRGALALFLHDHNPRTTDAETADLPPDEEAELPPHFPAGRPAQR